MRTFSSSIVSLVLAISLIFVDSVCLIMNIISKDWWEAAFFAIVTLSLVVLARIVYVRMLHIETMFAAAVAELIIKEEENGKQKQQDDNLEKH